MTGKLSSQWPISSSEIERYIIVIRWKKTRIGLIVDEIIGQQDSVVQPFDETIQHLVGYQGTAAVGKGHVSLVMDVETLFSDIFPHHN